VQTKLVATAVALGLLALASAVGLGLLLQASALRSPSTTRS
jgi:hypothetical protein